MDIKKSIWLFIGFLKYYFLAVTFQIELATNKKKKKEALQHLDI